MRLNGVACRSHHNHWKWGHRGHCHECKCAYECVCVGGMFRGGGMYASTTRLNQSRSSSRRLWNCSDRDVAWILVHLPKFKLSSSGCSIGPLQVPGKTVIHPV